MQDEPIKCEPNENPMCQCGHEWELHSTLRKGSHLEPCFAVGCVCTDFQEAEDDYNDDYKDED